VNYSPNFPAASNLWYHYFVYCRFDALVDSLTQQTGIPQSHMELFFDNHPFKPPTSQVKDLPITTVSVTKMVINNLHYRRIVQCSCLADPVGRANT